MVDVAPGVITNGLGGSATNMILGHFHLGYIDITIGGSPLIPPVTPPSGGPGGAGVRPFDDRYRDEDELDEHKIEVTIKVRFGQVWHERKYWILPKNAGILVKIINMANTSLSRVRLSISGVQNKMKAVYATISNIRNKSDKE